MHLANEGINYVNACSGGLRFNIQKDGEEFGRRADSIEDGVYFVENYGLADALFFASDMDFATEEGFETDNGAKKFFDDILNAYNEKLGDEVPF